MSSRSNFPALSKKKGPASPNDLIRESHLRKKQSNAHAKYRGVSRNGGRLWDATLKLRGRNAGSLGKWPTARLAAKAHDRAALHHGLPKRCLNFPDSIELKPSDGDALNAESRILVGFDRLLGLNVSLCLRLGFAFGGGPTTIAGAKFLPFHGELRANYWFGSDPFESSGLRPYVSLSGGVADVDGHVLVEYYDASGGKGTLDTWRKTGKGFAGLGFGVMIPIGSSGIIPEVRVKEMLGSAATAFDLALGYAYGF